MSVILECPVCESRFRAKKVPARLTCPSCKTNFKPQQAAPAIATGSNEVTPPPMPKKPSGNVQAPRRLQSAPTGQTPEINSTIAPPKFQARAKSRDVAGSNGMSKPALENTDNSQVVSEFQVSSGNRATSAYPMRKKKNVWATVTSIMLAVLAVGGLFAIVTILGQPSGTGESSKKEDGQKNEVADDDPGSLDKAVAGKTNTEPDLPPIDESLESFDKRKAEIAWNRVNNYLVKLEVKSLSGTRNQTGLIVDTRGWVVTSLSGLKDAGEVNVVLASKNLTDDPPFRQLVDLSRGLIATDPVHDLAIISINRAQVISVSDVKFAEQDQIVRSAGYLIARTPPKRHKSWLTECRISDAGSQSGLGEPIRKALQDANVPSENDSKWIAYPPALDNNLGSEIDGSPLIDESGVVVAINTSIVCDQKKVAVPAHIVQALIASVTENLPEPKPFSRSREILQQQTGSPDSANGPDTSVAQKPKSKEQEIEAILSRLENAMDTCRKTDWSAELESEYAAMQNLSQNLDMAFTWMSRNRRSLDDREQYEKQFDDLLQEMTRSIEDDLDRQEFLEGKGNEFFFSMVTQENPYFLLSAKVVSDQINSPQVGNQATVVFTVIGTGKNVMAAAGPDARSFKTGRKFFLLGKLDPRGKINFNMTEAPTKVSLINVNTHFLLQNIEAPKANRLDGIGNEPRKGKEPPGRDRAKGKDKRDMKRPAKQ